MPTRGRRELARLAVKSFAAQTYPWKELVIVDDEEEPSFKDGIDAGDIRVVYLRRTARNIAGKRNICIGAASGDIICHFDSDDWSAPTRIADQVARLEESGRAVTGYHSMLFYSEEQKAAYLYKNDSSYAIGTSLMFRRDFWQQHTFKDQRTPWGEDNHFVKEAREFDELLSVDAGQLMVARIHSDNTCVKEVGPASVEYRPVPLDHMPEGFLSQ